MDRSYNNPFGNNQMPAGGMPGGGVTGAPNMGMPVGYDAGDVVINSDEKKPRKGLIIGIIAGLLIVIVGVITVVIVSSNMPLGGSGNVKLSKDAKEKWGEYYDYLMYGPEREMSEEERELDNEEGDGKTKETKEPEKAKATLDDWYPAIIEDDVPAGFDEENFYAGYYSELESKFDDFYDNSNTSLTVLNEYAEMVGAFIDYKTLNTIWNDVYSEYNDGGEEKATEFIQKIEEKDSSNNSAKALYYDIARVLYTRLAEVQLYDSAGCYSDGVLSQECVDGLESDELDDIIDSLARVNGNLEQYYDSAFEPEMFQTTDNLNTRISGS